MKTEKQIISEYFRTLGKRSLKTMTKEQRSERASKAGKARWAKDIHRSKKKKSCKTNC